MKQENVIIPDTNDGGEGLCYEWNKKRRSMEGFLGRKITAAYLKTKHEKERL